MANTTALEIHPAIGISRVGSSEDYLLGPEPGLPIDSDRRDSTPNKLLKRQAARFRVFSCTREANGSIVAFTELTPDKATITWTVHLVNRKAAAPKFLNGNSVNTDHTLRRNHATGDDTNTIDKKLIIDGGINTITGASQPKKAFHGSFQGHDVPLGEISTDADGRLIVVGGFGTSQTFVPNNAIGGEFADNDGWHDDTSDGPVSATVHFFDGSPDRQVDKPAWVISCQPDFAPGIGNIVTLYDAMIDQAIQRNVLPMPTFKPAFDRDVMPILERALNYQWVNKFNRGAHGSLGPGDFTTIPDLDDPTASSTNRQKIFNLLRDPEALASAPPLKAMPALLADDYFSDPGDETHKRVLALSRPQYRILKEWAAGTFDKSAPPNPVEPLPDLLTRTALEACVGASFCPGIEAGRKIRDATIYKAGEVFYFDHSILKPGGLTESMALPWQADFSLCRWEGANSKGRGWWPAQRPDHVLLQPNDDTSEMVSWQRGAENPDKLVLNWDKLGVVLETTDPVAGTVFIETQRLMP
jgi:hypothetical protein